MATYMKKEYVTWEEAVPVIQYESLSETGCVEHGISTRFGGVSRDGFESMNLSYTRGDLKERVDENFRRMGERLHIDWKKIVSTDQTHTSNVRVVTEKDAGHGIIRPREVFDVDGQITNVPGLPLISYHADCVPLLFLDPIQKAIGLSHSGWKGTAGRIGAVTVRKMAETYGSKPEDILAVIGPSICQECYEVSEDVARFFMEGYDMHPGLLKAKKNSKYQLNLWEVNRQILVQEGIPMENITLTRWCTCCHPDLLFSHRKMGDRRGSLAAFLCLK